MQEAWNSKVEYNLLPSQMRWDGRNIPHDSMDKKPSYLLFGENCRNPTDAEFLNPTCLYLTNMQDYHKVLSFSLASARDIAAKAVQAPQKRYKRQYDKRVKSVTY